MEWLVTIMVDAADADAIHDLVAGWTLSPGAMITMINSAQPISVIEGHHEVDDQGNVGPMRKLRKQASVRMGPSLTMTPQLPDGGTTRV